MLLVFLLCQSQALQLGQDANSPYGIFNGQRCQMCLRSDPLQKVIERLANPGKFCSLVMLVLICSHSDPLQKVIERPANPGKFCSLVMLVLICSQSYHLR